jgi:hypothetical protein
MKFVNSDLLLNPLNWLVVLTMIFFSLFLMALISPQGE